MLILQKTLILKAVIPAESYMFRKNIYIYWYKFLNWCKSSQIFLNIRKQFSFKNRHILVRLHARRKGEGGKLLFSTRVRPYDNTGVFIRCDACRITTKSIGWSWRQANRQTDRHLQNLITLPHFLISSSFAVVVMVACARDLLGKELRIDKGTALNAVCTLFSFMGVVSVWLFID